MLRAIKTILDIRKEIPDAVGYDTYGPISFPLPKEIQELLGGYIDKPNFINITSIRVDNYSPKVQKQIRILYVGDYVYEPIFKFHRRDIPVKFSVKKIEKEFVVEELPPNESVSIEIFYPHKDFGVVLAISGDSEITTTMQKLAEARRYPELVRIKLFTYAIAIFAVVIVPFLGYAIWDKNQENNRINEALSEFASCSFTLMKNPPDNEKILERKFSNVGIYWQNYILSSNKVKSLDELKLKNEVVWCEPRKP